MNKQMAVGKVGILGHILVTEMKTKKMIIQNKKNKKIIKKPP